jgi:MFS family permease
VIGSTEIRGALSERNVRLLVGGTTVSQFGSGMAAVALAFAVLHIGSAADLGYTFLAREIPMVIFLLAGGVWADRISRKLLLVAGDLMMGSAQAVTALLFLTHHATILRVVLLQVAFGLAQSFTRPAQAGLIAQAVSAVHLQQANALIDLGGSTVRIVGPALGGIIVAAANPGWALAVDATSFLVAASLRVRLRYTEGERAERKNIFRELHEGWGEFKARTWCWTMVVSFGVFQLTFFPSLLVLGPLVAKTDLGGAKTWGIVLACQGAGSVVGGLFALRLHPARPLLWSSLLMLPTAGLLALLGVAAPTIVLCLAGFVASLGITCGDILWFTTFQREVPEHLLARLSSFDWFGSICLNPIGYALVGPISNSLGVATTLYVAAAINACISLAVASVPAIRSMRAPDVAIATA